MLQNQLYTAVMAVLICVMSNSSCCLIATVINYNFPKEKRQEIFEQEQPCKLFCMLQKNCKKHANFLADEVCLFSPISFIYQKCVAEIKEKACKQGICKIKNKYTVVLLKTGTFIADYLGERHKNKIHGVLKT